LIDYNSIVSDFDSQRDPRATICHGKSASKASLSRAQAAKPAGDIQSCSYILTDIQCCSPQACGSSGGSSLHSTSPRQSPGRDDQQGGIVARLMREEEVLRREVPGLANGGGGLGDKEMMILLQQRKIAALDEANNRLIHELSKLGEKVTTGGRCVKKTSMQETPKTVDELLDSFNDTRV